MTRIGPADVTRDPEGRVVLKHCRQLDRPGVTFTPAEWNEFLFGPDSFRLYGGLSWTSCPLPQAGAPDRPVLTQGRQLVRTDWG